MNAPEIPFRSGPWKYKLLLSLAIAMFALGLYWYLYIRLPCLAEFRAGGIRMTLVKVVEGPLHMQVSDPLPRWVRTQIPSISRIIPMRLPVDISSDEVGPRESNWFVFHMDVAPNTFPPMANQLFKGIEFEADGHVCPGTDLWGTGEFIVYRSDSVPRRSRKLTVRLEELNGKLIEFTIDNPFFREHFPEWTPGPMPAQATRGPFTVELTDFECRTGQGVFPLVKCECSDPSLQPCFVHATLEDATGNRGPFISPNEKAWKVVANLSVPVTAKSPLNERIPIAKITIPPANTVVLWNPTDNQGVVNLPIRAVAGPGDYQLVKGKWQVGIAKDADARVQGPALLCDFGAMRVAGVLQIKSLQGDSRSLGKAIKSTQFESRTTYDLRNYSPGDQVEIELNRSSTERFEFIVAPPEKTRH